MPQKYSNGEILRFKISFRMYQHRSSNFSARWNYTEISPMQRYHTFENLREFTRYEFEVRAATVAGDGPVAWTEAKTYEGGMSK